MTGLRISDELVLPVEVAGEAIAMLAKRGAGKTNTATVLVEELDAHGVQVVILDPVGAWWGLRSSADGKSPGLSIAILGGQHGDVPLEPAAGALIADVVVDSGQSLLIDLSDFPSKAAVGRFVADFADRLFRRKARASSLLHVVLEEADLFAPQRVTGDAARMQGAIEQIVRRGRSRGIGLTMITQRSAVLSKDILTQADVLVVMRTTGPHDQAAIRAWIDAHDDDQADVVGSLSSLETGEAWIWNPERSILKRVKIRRRRTFDSSSTPKAGQRRVDPKAAAAIDLTVLGAEIQATAERAKENDPAELRKRIRELEHQLQESFAAGQKPRIVEKVVEVYVPLNFDALREVAMQLRGEFDEMVERLDTSIGAVLYGIGHLEGQQDAATSREPEAGKRIPRTDGQTPITASSSPARETPPPRSRPPAPRLLLPAGSAGGVSLGKGERKVLDVLVDYPDGRTQNNLAFLAGYSAKASTIGVILSNLRRAELVTGGQPVRLTELGLAAAGGARERPTGAELLAQWLQHPRMGEGERKVLRWLIKVYPDEPSHEYLCEATGYSPTASTMGVILSKLRKLGLVEKGHRRLDPEFHEAISE